MNTIANVANDFNAPLTKNEIDLFASVIGLNKYNGSTSEETINMLAQISKSFQNIAQTLGAMHSDWQVRQVETVSAIKNIKEEIKLQNEINRKQIAAINQENDNITKTSPIFYSTLSARDRQSWRKIIEGDIERARIETGRNLGNIHLDLYAGMRKLGYDVNKYLEEYRKDNPDASIMDMCVASDILRAMLQAQVEIMKNNIINNKIKPTITKKKNSKYTFIQANRCPAEITKMIATLSKSGKWSAWSSKKILAELDKKIDVNKIANNFMRKNKISKCNKWFAVSQNKKAMEVLGEMIVAPERF